MMRWNFGDKLALMFFGVFAGAYLLMAAVVCNDELKSAFDVIQGAHVFDVDDTYRLFLARDPFVDLGLWTWNFFLPVNIVFDGFFSWLTGHDVYIMRASHIFAVLSSLYLVYRAGRHLQIAAGWMLLACIIFLAMPLFILLSMSFYGESLLAAAMGVVVYSIATKKERLQVFFLSLFPLIRPEGFFFLSMVVVQKILERRLASVFFIVLPGFIFFCFVMLLFDYSYYDFNQWRRALGEHYPLGPVDESVMGYSMMPYYAINPVLWLLGLAGAFSPQLRRFRPLFIAVLLLMLHWTVDSLAMKARAEPRYFFAAFPLMSLSLGAILQIMNARLQRLGIRKWLAAFLVCSLPAFIVVENLAQLDPIRAEFFQDRRWPLAGEPGAKPYFGVLPPEVIEARRATAKFLEAYTRYDASIKKVIIHAFPVFNDVDPGQLPTGVVVEYSPMMPKKTYQYYGGYFYSMFPRLPQFTFYQFSPAPEVAPNDGGAYALYVGPLYNGIHEPIYANPYFQVYKVKYETRQTLPDAVLKKEHNGIATP